MEGKNFGAKEGRVLSVRMLDNSWSDDRIVVER